ncbi:thioredoxin domain-containing protein [Microbacterium resistens]|uniref:DsbA family protein n=1 Tax=Microbacterium resistens TaxID=156977 RepID=UPI001C56CF13|nr:thioredoxin domain-containing protein [Microbacterium resistens]MBW1639299.1 thioredoxin domain-containing protein [Microbacterium resistens]
MSESPRPDPTELTSKLTFYRRLTAALAIVVVFLGIVVVAQLTMNTGSAAPAAQPTTSSSPEVPELARRDPDDPMALGKVDAPVALVQWTDLRCPFCAAVHRDTIPTIIEEYVDKGLVRLEVRDVAFFGEQSEDAAVAARAAGEQGRFFEYLDAVYAAAPDSGHPDLPREKLIAFAKEAGIPDLDRFTADLDDPAVRAAAQASTAEAQRLGVSAVPFFVANDTALSGAQPVAVFRDFLDRAIAQKG